MHIKKHIQQENYLSWGEQFSVFEPLSAAEEKTYTDNPKEFQKRFPSMRLFPDPFLDVQNRNLPIPALKDAVIIVNDDKPNRQIAERLNRGIAEKYNVSLDIVSDETELDFWGTLHPMILIGGVADNRWSRKMGQRLQLGVFDQDFPGAAGWGITIYQNIQEGMGIRYVLACAEETCNEAIKYFLEHAVVAGKDPQLQWIHHVRLDKNLPAEFHNFDVALEHYKQTPLTILNDWLVSDHRTPYRKVFQKVLLSLRDAPIVPNSGLLDVGIFAIRYYQLTGDEKALHLFREMLWAFWEYLNSDDPNIYISDMDFRLGQICAYWSWIEFHPTITDEERRIFSQLLLGAMRMVHAYYLEKWASKEMPAGTCHNHQTFKARCLLYGWRYFHQFRVPDAEVWKKDADALFEGADAARTKYTENANKYEGFTPEHLLAWHEITGREISPEFQHALAEFAWREWALTDNFLQCVEYGDCDVIFRRRKPFQAAPWLDQSNPAFADIIALEQNTAREFPPEIPTAFYSFGRFLSKPGTANWRHLMTGWTRIALEPKLRNQYDLQGNAEQWFDKLAWKSGWQETSAYLAIEGFGNKTVSHAHNATSSIIRANFGGRVWLVGNGYGKKVGVTAAGQAFSTRELGPVDHNMLILRDGDGVPLIPPVNSFLVDYSESPLPFAVVELQGYGGCKWIRHSFLLGEMGLIVIDSLIAETADSLPDEFSLEWNILGDVTKNAHGAVINQSGVKLTLHHFDTAETQWDYNASASWHRVMQNKEYPYTSNPLEKCILKPASKDMSSNEYHFVSGFWLDSAVRHADWNPATSVLTAQMEQSLKQAVMKYSAAWGDIAVDGNSLQINLTSHYTS